MDPAHGKETRMAGGTWKMAEQHETDKHSSELTALNKENGEQQNNGKNVDFLKEATLVLDLTGNKDIKVEDIIKGILEKVDVDNLLAVRPRRDMEYELTLRSVEVCDGLMDGLEISGQYCEVRRLERREYIVSFLHLPAYLHDKTIEDKLKSWGVTPMTKVRRRLYPGTNIADGTRYVKVRFPKDRTSLPYSTQFETNDGLQFFRVIHDGQVRLCRMCFQSGHFFKDCPNFTCFECGEQGHYARNCKAEKCPDCKNVFMKCDCVTESEGENVTKETGTENVEESMLEMEQEMSEGEKGFEPQDFKTRNGKETEKGKAVVDGVVKKRKRKSQRKDVMETELNVEAENDIEGIGIGNNKIVLVGLEGTLMEENNVLEPKASEKGHEQNNEKEEQKQHREKEMVNGKSEMSKEMTYELSVEDVDFAQVKIVDGSTIKPRSKEKGNVVRNKLKHQSIGGHVLKYKTIPNLNLVLKKQKLRRTDLEKKRRVVEYYLD